MRYVKKEIYALLSTIANTYYEYSPSSASFPNIVYKFSAYSKLNHPRIDVILETYVQVESQVTDTLDTLCASIRSALDRRLINTANVNIKIYYTDTLEDSDDSERTYRARILRFEMQVYEK